MGDPLRLYGLNALVFNAASGIGEASARTLIRHGATVVAVDAENSGVEQLFAAVKGITGLAANFMDGSKIADIVTEAVDLLNGIDILVNDFSLRQDGPLTDDDPRIETMLQSRSVLTMEACRAAMPFLKRSPAGRIVNMGMLRACFAVDAGSLFVRAEQDLANLTRELAADVGEFGVNANYVQPGSVMTPESRELYSKDPALRDHGIRNSAARRIGEPVDVAKVVLFLASDDSVFVSGTGVAVDGGRLPK